MSPLDTVTGVALVEALAAAGISADLFHSGGGCATIGIGGIVDEDEGRYLLLAGPGLCSWHDPAGTAEFGYDELYIGPDDDGESEVGYEVRSVEELVEYAVELSALLAGAGA